MKDMNPEEQEFLNQPWMTERELPRLSAEVKRSVDRALFGRSALRPWMMAAAAVLAVMLLGYWLFEPVTGHQGNLADQAKPAVVDSVVKPPVDSVFVAEAPSRLVTEPAPQPLKHSAHPVIHTNASAAPVELSPAVADHPGILETCPEIF